MCVNITCSYDKAILPMALFRSLLIFVVLFSVFCFLFCFWFSCLFWLCSCAAKGVNELIPHEMWHATWVMHGHKANMHYKHLHTHSLAHLWIFIWIKINQSSFQITANWENLSLLWSEGKLCHCKITNFANHNLQCINSTLNKGKATPDDIRYIWND